MIHPLHDRRVNSHQHSIIVIRQCSNSRQAASRHADRGQNQHNQVEPRYHAPPDHQTSVLAGQQELRKVLLLLFTVVRELLVFVLGRDVVQSDPNALYRRQPKHQVADDAQKSPAHHETRNQQRRSAPRRVSHQQLPVTFIFVKGVLKTFVHDVLDSVYEYFGRLFVYAFFFYVQLLCYPRQFFYEPVRSRVLSYFSYDLFCQRVFIQHQITDVILHRRPRGHLLHLSHLSQYTLLIFLFPLSVGFSLRLRRSLRFGRLARRFLVGRFLHLPRQP